MTTQITTIPSNPTEYNNFFLNYSEINNEPISLNTYVLQNTSNINVSNPFITPSGGIYTGPTISPLQTCSYIVKDSNNNFYFTDNQSFFTVPSSVGNYNVYKATVNPNSINIFISYTMSYDLIDSNPIGLAIDNSETYLYVALQTGNIIKRYNLSNGTGEINFISGGDLNGPCGMIFDSNGNLYVANRFSNSILKYDSSGSTLLLTITNSGFDEPCAININSLGELFVSNVNYLLFKVDLTLPITVTEILNNSGRQSVNMAFDIDNNIYLPDFNDDILYKVPYNNWSSYTTQSIYGGDYRLGGIILDKFGDIIIANTNSSGNTVRIDLKFLSYWFTSVNLPGGYNTLRLYNSTINSLVSEFTVFVKGSTPGPSPAPAPDPGTICFKEGTKILCKLNGQDVYIPVENIEEGTLVKTYKNGYKKCKFNMIELLKNTENHNINNLFRQSKLTNSNLFEDLYITGSHSMLYDNLTEKEEEAMYKLLATYNSKFDIEIPNRIEDKYKLIAYYDKRFTEVKQNISVYIYHLVLESDNNNRNYGIWANGVLTESIDEFSLLRHLNNSNIKLVNVAKRNNKILNNVFLSKSTMNLQIDNKPLGTKLMNKHTMFK